MDEATYSASTSPDGTSYCARRLLTTLIFGVMAASMMQANSDSRDELFEHYQVVTGMAKHQTVLPGFFLGGDTAEIAVVHIDQDRNCRLQMFGFDGHAWGLVLDVALRPNILFVDVANIGGHDRLMTYERGRLNWFDPESATERPLLHVATHYNATHRKLWGDEEDLS